MDPFNLTNDKKWGSGVSVAVHPDLAASLLRGSLTSSKELWLRVECRGVFVVFGTVYIPPGSDFEVYQNFLILLSLMSICVFGDFKLSNVLWRQGDDFNCLCPSNVKNVVDQCFCDTMSFNGLSQFNLLVNKYGHTLDLVFSNISSVVVSERAPVSTPFTLL